MEVSSNVMAWMEHLKEFQVKILIRLVTLDGGDRLSSIHYILMDAGIFLKVSEKPVIP